MEDRKFAPDGSSSPAAPIHHPALNASVSAGRASTVEWIEGSSMQDELKQFIETK